MILMKIVYSFVSQWVERVPYRIVHPIYVISVIFIIFDLIVTYSAFERMSFKNQDKKPFTFIEEIYDGIYV